MTDSKDQCNLLLVHPALKIDQIFFQKIIYKCVCVWVVHAEVIYCTDLYVILFFQSILKTAYFSMSWTAFNIAYSSNVVSKL